MRGRGRRKGDARLILALGAENPCAEGGEDDEDEADEDAPATLVDSGVSGCKGDSMV